MTADSYFVPDLSDSEEELRATFGSLPEAALIQMMTYNLGGLIDRCPMLSAVAPQPGAKRDRCHAVFFISVRMLRAVRAAMSLLAVGYQLEASAIERLALELTARLQPIVNDPTGEAARRWLFTAKGRAGVGAAFREIAPEGVPPNAIFNHLSMAAHADPRAVVAWLAEGDDTVQRIRWEPHRDDRATRASLIMLADVAYGAIKALAQEYALEINRQNDLEAAMDEGNRAMAELLRGDAP